MAFSFVVSWLRSRTLRAAAVLLLCAGLAPAPTAVPGQLQDLSRKYLDAGDAASRAALLAYAERAGSNSVEGLARLALGVGDHEAKRYPEAAEQLGLAAEKLTELGEYALYYRAKSLAAIGNHAGSAWVLTDFAKRFPDSRLTPAAVRVRAEGLIRSDHIALAREVLESGKDIMAPPVRLWLLARTQELDAQLLDAVRSYRRVYYEYPLSEQAADAELQLRALSAKLGQAYPPAQAAWRFERAEKLYQGGQYGRAQAQYKRAIPGLRGIEKETAQVRWAAADYKRLHTTAARRQLAGLTISNPELDAERLYYLVQCERRRRNVKESARLCDELGGKYPKSPWYQEALFSLGNYHLLENERREARQYYERTARAFPKGEYAPLAHWKVCWWAHLEDDPRARSLLEEHLRLYPASPQATAAIYWLARIAEKGGDAALAQGLYTGLIDRFPHYYYSALARGRLADLAASSQPVALQDTGAQRYFTQAPEARALAREPSAATNALLRRSRILFDLGLTDFAEKELQHADYRAPDAHWIGQELARQTTERGAFYRGLRHMKRYATGYLRFPIDTQPRPFWESLYPLPWANQLRAQAKSQGLDPYLVAGLIRQESEFHAAAHSRAGALGLMQIMPATGRGLAKQLGISPFTTRNLYQPETSLRLGTYHLKTVLDDFQGRLEYALAAYNAGKSRVDRWITWGTFDEPGEFAETIPFTETRGYVQAVIRNASIYQQLYGGDSQNHTLSAKAE